MRFLIRCSPLSLVLFPSLLHGTLLQHDKMRSQIKSRERKSRMGWRMLRWRMGFVLNWIELYKQFDVQFHVSRWQFNFLVCPFPPFFPPSPGPPWVGTNSSHISQFFFFLMSCSLFRAGKDGDIVSITLPPSQHTRTVTVTKGQTSNHIRIIENASSANTISSFYSVWRTQVRHCLRKQISWPHVLRARDLSCDFSTPRRSCDLSSRDFDHMTTTWPWESSKRGSRHHDAIQHVILPIGCYL
jgi:hypothetical protein